VEITKGLKVKEGTQSQYHVALKQLGMRTLSHTNCLLLLEEDIFKVLMDPDDSTSHRRFFTIGESVKVGEALN
jgi:hypothetical protein